jgi:hypothetical protein
LTGFPTSRYAGLTNKNTRNGAGVYAIRRLEQMAHKKHTRKSSTDTTPRLKSTYSHEALLAMGTEFVAICPHCYAKAKFTFYAGHKWQTKRGDRWGLLRVVMFECNECHAVHRCQSWKENAEQMDMFAELRCEVSQQ